MMDQTVSKLLNEQINKEFYSAYLYLDIANFYDDTVNDHLHTIVYANYIVVRVEKHDVLHL